MTISKSNVESAYQRQAKRYETALKLYQLMGLRIQAYRARAVELLHLKRGDRVVDLGCGTGLSFPLILQRIGPEGELIGVDRSVAMLECAQERTKRSGWSNVRLVLDDLAEYKFPEGVNAVLSIGVFGYIAEHDRVIETIAQALGSGGRMVIVDGKQPGRWPGWMFRLFIWCSRGFGVSEAYFHAHARSSMEQYFHNTTVDEVYGGLLYISSGSAGPSST